MTQPQQTPSPAEMLINFVNTASTRSARVVDRIGAGNPRRRQNSFQPDPEASDKENSESARVHSIYADRRRAAQRANSGASVGEAARNVTGAVRSLETGESTGEAQGVYMGGLGQGSLQGGMFQNPRLDRSSKRWGGIMDAYNRASEERAFGGNGSHRPGWQGASADQDQRASSAPRPNGPTEQNNLFDIPTEGGIYGQPYVPVGKDAPPDSKSLAPAVYPSVFARPRRVPGQLGNPTPALNPGPLALNPGPKALNK